MLSACHQIAGWSPQRTQGQSPLLGYGHSTVSIARPDSRVEFSIAKLMLIPSLSPGLLCSWVTEQGERWLRRTLTDIHSRGHLSHLIAKVPLSLFFFFTDPYRTQISSYPVSKDIYLHTIFKTVFFMDLTIVPLIIPPNLWPHFINWYRAGHLAFLLLGKNKQAITLTEALPFTEKQVHVPNTQGG